MQVIRAYWVAYRAAAKANPAIQRVIHWQAVLWILATLVFGAAYVAVPQALSGSTKVEFWAVVGTQVAGGLSLLAVCLLFSARLLLAQLPPKRALSSTVGVVLKSAIQRAFNISDEESGTEISSPMMDSSRSVQVIAKAGLAIVCMALVAMCTLIPMAAVPWQGTTWGVIILLLTPVGYICGINFVLGILLSLNSARLLLSGRG